MLYYLSSCNIRLMPVVKIVMILLLNDFIILPRLKSPIQNANSDFPNNPFYRGNRKLNGHESSGEKMEPNMHIDDYITPAVIFVKVVKENDFDESYYPKPCQRLYELKSSEIV